MEKCSRCGQREPCGCAERDKSRRYNTGKAQQDIYDNLVRANTKLTDIDDQEVKYRRKMS